MYIFRLALLCGLLLTLFSVFHLNILQNQTEAPNFKHIARSPQINVKFQNVESNTNRSARTAWLHPIVQAAEVTSTTTKRTVHLDRNWFMKGGVILPRPAPKNESQPYLWYNKSVDSDRIIAQLMWTIESPAELNSSKIVPKENGTTFRFHQTPDSEQKIEKKLKTILLYHGLLMSWGIPLLPGRSLFLQKKCPVNRCRLTGNPKKIGRADLVVFHDYFKDPSVPRPASQLWLMSFLESPRHTQTFNRTDTSLFNLTATYRHDSDIVTPYEKWVYYNPAIQSKPQTKNYAEGKTYKVAMFISNCHSANNRLEYAQTLAKYIDVDIYGSCGAYYCPRSHSKLCHEMISKNYKFYLAFENSNCRDYITEKFFVNGLSNDILPIVMGAHPDDYERVAPKNSYIHVEEFIGPQQLAEYLHKLDKNDTLYNQYFQWKGTGEYIDTSFFCRLCAMTHYFKEYQPKKPGNYEDFNKWWRADGTCTSVQWRDTTTDIFAKI